MRKLLVLLVIVTLAGCSTVDVRQYSGNTPRLDLHSYFLGETRGWGMVQDRKGRLTRQFVVAITGSLDTEGNLVLQEDFKWSDGEVSERTWTITRIDENRYSGKAGDVVGLASGVSHGNVLQWNYYLNVEVDGSTWKIYLDDWMFLQPDDVLLNRTTMSKFGFHVGDITIVFTKLDAKGEKQ